MAEYKSPNDPTPWDALFAQSDAKNGLPAGTTKAAAWAESRFNPAADAGPNAGKGIMQFVNSTAKERGVNPFDPASAIPAAGEYLRELIDAKGGNLGRGLQSYNMGAAGESRFVAGDMTVKGDPKYSGKVLSALGQINKEFQSSVATVATVAAVSNAPSKPQTPTVAASSVDFGSIKKPSAVASIGTAADANKPDALIDFLKSGTAFDTAPGAQERRDASMRQAFTDSLANIERQASFEQMQQQAAQGELAKANDDLRESLRGMWDSFDQNARASGERKGLTNYG